MNDKRVAYFVACPNCADRDGPYICEGVITRVDENGQITIRNQVGGAFYPASPTPEQAVADHAKRHLQQFKVAVMNLQPLLDVAERAESLEASKLRVVRDVTRLGAV